MRVHATIQKRIIKDRLEAQRRMFSSLETVYICHTNHTPAWTSRDSIRIRNQRHIKR